jgi:hypothetical protein
MDLNHRPLGYKHNVSATGQEEKAHELGECREDEVHMSQVYKHGQRDELMPCEIGFDTICLLGSVSAVIWGSVFFMESCTPFRPC